MIQRIVIAGGARIAAIALVVALAAPAAGVGETHEDWDWMRCWGAGDATFGCDALLRATVEVIACDAVNCTIAVNATLTGGANVPGIQQAHIYLSGGNQGGSICLGSEQVQDAADDYIPCGSVCDKNGFGFQGGCQGKATVNLTMPAGGTRVWIGVNSIYGWNVYGGQADPGIWFQFRHNEDDTVEISSFGENVW